MIAPSFLDIITFPSGKMLYHSELSPHLTSQIAPRETFKRLPNPSTSPLTAQRIIRKLTRY